MQRVYHREELQAQLSPMSHAGYYPGGKVMTLKVVFEKGTYRLLGAQIVGYEGVDKRIDVLATAIHAGLSALQLKDLDLAYAPPYSSAKDPVNMADLQNNMRSLQASYNAAKLGRDNAKSTYDSNKLLYDEEIISKNEFDQIKYAYESADAQLASIQVQMDNLKKNISDCTVTSPMTGVIATRGVEKGSFASQAAPAYTVMDLSTIKVEVSVSEQVLNTIQVGDKVSVLMTAASETPLTGTVATIAPAAEQTGMYTVKVELDNKDGKIKSGMMAEVSFTMAASDDTILLPRNAVIEKDNETYVYVINNGKAKKTAVELGIEAEDTIEIKSGLKKGDNVVTKGQTYLSDGEEVTIANTAAKTKEKTKTTEKGE